jgi:hypothetical protein
MNMDEAELTRFSKERAAKFYAEMWVYAESAGIDPSFLNNERFRQLTNYKLQLELGVMYQHGLDAGRNPETKTMRLVFRSLGDEPQ